MRRILTLWLTFLAAFWFTRTAVSALLWERVDNGFAALLQLATIPLLQALVIAWATREPGSGQPSEKDDFDPAGGPPEQLSSS
jgi:hypothetical protein